MTIKKIALGACLLVSGTALAQDKTYTVREGDTLSGIASRFGVKSQAILQANHLPSANKLKLGQPLRIPVTAKIASSPSLTKVSGYAVQTGDNDQSIAKKLGVTAKELRLANMGTKWTKLQIGQVLTIPGSKTWFDVMAQKAATTPQTVAEVAKPSTQAHLVSAKTEVKTTVVPKTYKVRDGDNDWIIAKHIGIKPSELRALNAGVKWQSLKIGTVLHVPGTVVKSNSNSSAHAVLANKVDNEPNLPKIRSRYAVVTGEDVTVRRGPSTRFDEVTKVDKGTRVLVLDKEGAWYKLRFPRGTEAWVRGDFLAPTKAPQLVAAVVEKKKSKKSSAGKTTVVASKTNRSTSRDGRSARVAWTRASKNHGPAIIASGNGDNVMAKADSYLGVRYRYGAASRSSTDCSGFTTQVYRSMGVKLPRTAREQSGKGQKVDKSGLKAGDLVFFKTRGSRVSHVGIYKGDGKFIHASSGGGKVMVSSLNEGYYQRRFAGARRVMNNSSAKSKKKSATTVAKVEKPKTESVDAMPTPVEPKVSTPPDNGGN